MISEPRKPAACEPNRASSHLTKQQKDATVQKWAGWILKQRQIAEEQKQAEDGGVHDAPV
jgi:hypothetical protein